MRKIIVSVFVLIGVALGGWYYWQNNNMYLYIDKDKISYEYKVDEINSKYLKLKDTGLGIDYVLKNFTFTKLDKDIDINSNMEFRKKSHERFGYEELSREIDTITYRKSETYGANIYHIDIYTDNNIMIEAVHATERELTEEDLEDLILEGRSFIK